MGAVPVNTSSSHDGASVEPGTRIQHNQNGINNGSLPEEQCQGSSEEDGSTCNGIAEYGNNHPTWEVQACDDFQVQPQQPQGPIIVWERFLPLKTVKVLLVENDDSTRHVVSALLRNCGYEVTAVANGLQAWKILEDLTDQIDLVLTEVVMPLLSGIGLLSKIMGHKTLKNIPVIMMSSHDSMGIVFKCLSKGAVDFLVKPIRKNELKNLWQHVWRRCHSSSGSGSESVTHTKKSRDLRSNDDSETNNGSSDEQASRSNGLSMQNGSDDGSGTQSSWTKKTEVESPRPVSPWNGWADAPDSTCARVIYAGTEKLKLDEDDPGNGGQGDDGKQSPRCQDSQHDCQCETELNVSSVIELKPLDKGQTELNPDLGGKTGESKTAQMCGTANCISVQTESRVFDCGDDLSRISNIKSIAHCNPGELPSLELTLKRLEEQGNSGHSSHDNHKVLRHSDLSAFTKFNTVSSVNQGQAGNAGNCSAFDNCSTAMRRESNFPSSSHGTPCQQSNVGSNNNEMALGGKTPKQPEQLSTFKSSGSSAFQPVQHGYVSSSRQELSARAKDACSNLIQAPSNSSHQHIHIRYHHHHHHHHYHHHLDSLQQQEQQPEHEDSSLKSMAIAAPQCGSSNAFGGHTEGNNGNCSVNASVSGSNHGSNGDNGSNDAPNGGETIQRKDDGVAGNNGDGCAVEKVNGAALDERRIALREAALSKFRQKRKERCFEKRVRYESRKKLAEQRPRIRGQFVRQIASDRAANDCQSNDSLSRDNSCDSVQ